MCIKYVRTQTAAACVAGSALALDGNLKNVRSTAGRSMG